MSTLPLDQPDAAFFGGLEVRCWQAFVEGDALQLDAENRPVIPTTHFLLRRLCAHLTSLLPDGTDIPLSLWAGNGPFRATGWMRFRYPHFHLTGPAAFFPSGRLEKVIDPSGAATT